MRKLFSLVLAFVLCLPLIPAARAADDAITLRYTIRDFHADKLLFEGRISSGKGLVQETLGADKKPVYVLDQWQSKFGADVTQSQLDAFFNDVPGVNMSALKELIMRPDGNGYWTIDSSKNADGTSSPGFFPIDGALFGNEGNSHNYHFSVEIHTRFKYVQNAIFEFSGDDDVWVFFNGKLVIDLGGVHGSQSAKIELDKIAADLGVKIGDIVDFDMFYMERHMTGSNLKMSTNFEFLNLQASEWAEEELQKADDLGLIPDSLKGQDLTQPITRAEFAAVAVKAYEALIGTKAIPAVNNPFTDTKDAEVLKAFNVGITTGVSATAFEPDTLLNREQAATMLTRVFKKVSLAGWTIQTDGQFTLPYTMPTPFADDADISGWAKDSVYFMAANGIINGVGNNKFAPQNITDAEKAQGYANATREQALLIAVRMVENLR